MSEFVWYSRLVVWAGALVLLAQAAVGRGASFMTLFATICLTAGFVAFLCGLAITGRTQPPGRTAEDEPTRGPSKP